MALKTKYGAYLSSSLIDIQAEEARLNEDEETKLSSFRTLQSELQANLKKNEVLAKEIDRQRKAQKYIEDEVESIRSARAILYKRVESDADRIKEWSRDRSKRLLSRKDYRLNVLNKPVIEELKPERLSKDESFIKSFEQDFEVTHFENDAVETKTITSWVRRKSISISPRLAVRILKEQLGVYVKVTRSSSNGARVKHLLGVRKISAYERDENHVDNEEEEYDDEEEEEEDDGEEDDGEEEEEDGEDFDEIEELEESSYKRPRTNPLTHCSECNQPIGSTKLRLKDATCNLCKTTSYTNQLYLSCETCHIAICDSCQNL